MMIAVAVHVRRLTHINSTLIPGDLLLASPNHLILAEIFRVNTLITAQTPNFHFEVLAQTDQKSLTCAANGNELERSERRLLRVLG